MLVTHENFQSVIDHLANERELGLDTETYGLRWSDDLFSIAIADDKTEYYFNFKDYHGLSKDLVLDSSHLRIIRLFLLLDPYKRFFIHNAHFDIHKLKSFSSPVWCTQSIERILDNTGKDLSYYSLDECSKRRLGVEKDKAVEEYIQKHGLFTMREIHGKKKKVKDKHFDLVPFDIMSKYAMKDVRLHYDLGKAQMKSLEEQAQLYPPQMRAGRFLPGIVNIARIENELVPVVTRMEARGMLLNLEMVNFMVEQENSLIASLKEEFRYETGLEFKDSRATLIKAFDKFELAYPLTEKGNPSFKEEVLIGVSNPVADMVNRIRKASKRIGTYYSSYLYYKDSNDVIHANFTQSGAETGRFSSSNPNLQNIPKRGDSRIKECFKPRPGYCFVTLDYEQQELRMLLDYAGQKDMIEAINKGEDPHSLVAKMAGLTRDQAKTFVFSIIYGVGLDELANQLGVSRDEAKILRSRFYRIFPSFRDTIRTIMESAERRGYVMTWAGRVQRLKSTSYSYKMPNYLIQGGCADVGKLAMIAVDKILRDMKSALISVIHDEFIFEMHPDEFDLLPQIVEAMESTYKAVHGVKLTTSMSHSWESLGARHKQPGAPTWKPTNQQSLSPPQTHTHLI